MKNLSLCLVVFVFACGIAPAQTTAENPLGAARVFSFDEMKVRTMPNGTESRMIFNGTLATGESVGAHESVQPPGTVPPPLHKIQHSELVVIVRGTLEFDHDGEAERAGPGSIIYVALGTMHAIKNVGDGPAQYVIIQIGGDTKK
ncbi:MAG TPA: cupin domain-containing protein [Terracidiphilus sp.]|jgi:quercetin dioxygenase-like cupin family protein|nr:cupin domain-containing protein [Terracidiphilus sp.]